MAAFATLSSDVADCVVSLRQLRRTLESELGMSAEKCRRRQDAMKLLPRIVRPPEPHFAINNARLIAGRTVERVEVGFRKEIEGVHQSSLVESVRLPDSAVLSFCCWPGLCRTSQGNASIGSHLDGSIYAFAAACLSPSDSAVLSACGGGSSMPMNPVGPSPSGPSASLTGMWNGSLSDSSGSMMGAGLSPSMMGQMTWQITQTGNTFSGVAQVAGSEGHEPMRISGTIDGATATFTMTMPSGGMMTMNCTATATGTFDINEFMTQLHGTYAGSNTCSGPFDHGHMSLSR